MKNLIKTLAALTAAAAMAKADAFEASKVDLAYAPYSVAADTTLVAIELKEPPKFTFKFQDTPPPTISYESIYDFRDHATYAVVTRPMGELTHVLGTKLSLEAFGFVGADTVGAPVVGVGGKARIPIADQLDFFAGPGALFRQGRPFRVVAFIGVSFRFKQTEP